MQISMSKTVAVMAILAVLCAVTVLRAGDPYLVPLLEACASDTGSCLARADTPCPWLSSHETQPFCQYAFSLLSWKTTLAIIHIS